MSKLQALNPISIKNNPDINEAMIQKFIYENPSVLGLGEILPLGREKQQPSGGRLDLYMGDEDGQRYEVEIQLGDTDPSHIIRTIEYRDNERKKYPDYNHCAVIVAENITGRFMNVISLFNGHIPLIAIKMQAFKNGNDYDLAFTKILDRISLGIEDEDLDEVTDRKFREGKSSKSMLEIIDFIFSELNEFTSNYELKYNKFYIGLSQDGKANNFISFEPRKSWIYLRIRAEDKQENRALLDTMNKEYGYNAHPGCHFYWIKFKNTAEFQMNKEIFIELIKKTGIWKD